MSAPPTPCSPRAESSSVPLPDRATRIEAAMNTTAPSMNSRRRPNRSPVRPKVMSSAAKTSG